VPACGTAGNGGFPPLDGLSHGRRVAGVGATGTSLRGSARHDVASSRPRSQPSVVRLRGRTAVRARRPEGPSRGVSFFSGVFLDKQENTLARRARRSIRATPLNWRAKPSPNGQDIFQYSAPRAGSDLATCFFARTLPLTDKRYMLVSMIRSFRCRETQRLFETGRSRRWSDIRRVIERKLIQLHAAEALEDLASPPGNRLEALTGDRLGQHSMRVNSQWRLCFRWTDRGPEDVELVDYH